MRQQLPFSFAAVMVAMMVLPGVAGGQAVSLQEQLAAQYKLAQMGADSTGWSVIQEGTLLVVQKGGILGVPYKSAMWLPTAYKDGTVQSPPPLHIPAGLEKICTWFPTKCPTPMVQTTSYLFKAGDKVYPTKIYVNLDEDMVAMEIVACDACNNTNPPSADKAQVAFEFPKGALAKASAGDVEDMIGQLLSIVSDDQKADGGQQEQQGTQPGQDQQRPRLTPQPPAQSIELKKGMTPDQVEAALGTPDDKVNFENKQIYHYKARSLTVTFLNGQVSDVE